MYYIRNYASPIGVLTLAGDEDSVIGVWKQGQKYFGATLPQSGVAEGNSPVLDKTAQWLDRYFAGECPEITLLPLRPEGGEFRQEVWKQLCAIPYGKVATYGGIARAVAEKMGLKGMSAQAVGGAVGHNPISVIIPCHRVVGSNGSLTGYAGGVDTKLWLLRHEGADVSALFTPSKGTAL